MWMFGTYGNPDHSATWVMHEKIYYSLQVTSVSMFFCPNICLQCDVCLNLVQIPNVNVPNVRKIENGHADYTLYL